MKIPERRQLNTDVPFVPNGYINVNPDINAFGGSNANALTNVSKGLKDVSAAADKIADQVNYMQLLDFSNKVNDLRTNILYDKENGYLHKKGDFAAGKTDEIMNSYMSSADELLKKSALTGINKQRAANLIGSVGKNLYENVSSHDLQQTAVRDKTIFENCNTSQINTLLQNRNNPDAVSNYLANMKTATDMYANAQGLDNPTKEKLMTKSQANGVANLLQAYLADNNENAFSHAFEKYSSLLDPEVQNRFQAQFTQQKNDKEVKLIANSLIDTPIENVYEKINSIENTQLRNNVEHEYNRLLSQQKKIQTEKDRQISNEIMQKVFTAYDNGADISDIMREINVSDMSLEQKEKIYKNLKEMRELEGAGNNWADYNILLDMAAYNNEDFQNINPANYNLTKEQYNNITEMQRKSGKNEYTPEVEIKKAIDGMYNSKFNIQGREGLHKKEYENEVVKFLSKVERMQGKAFDYKNTAQLQAIMQGFDYKSPDEVNKNLDETKELYARAKKHGEVYDLMAREYMLFKGQNKREPKPEEFYEMAKRSYNTIENQWKEKENGKLNESQAVYKNVISTVPKKGETKVLTYYADVKLPQISREIGIPLQVTSRYRQGDKGNHGKGRKCDVGMAALNIAQRQIVFERLLSEPGIASIGTSDSYLLKKFNNPPNPKIRDLREYDASYKKTHPNTTMNHVNHIDISFDTRYGGDIQGVI